MVIHIRFCLATVPEPFLVSFSCVFRYVATMNPGGDYGKKELSPALKNRFSELWCPSLASSEDLLAIVARSLAPEFQELAERIIKFCTWLR